MRTSTSFATFFSFILFGALAFLTHTQTTIAASDQGHGDGPMRTIKTGEKDDGQSSKPRRDRRNTSTSRDRRDDRGSRRDDRHDKRRDAGRFRRYNRRDRGSRRYDRDDRRGQRYDRYDRREHRRYDRGRRDDRRERWRDRRDRRNDRRRRYDDRDETPSTLRPGTRPWFFGIGVGGDIALNDVITQFQTSLQFGYHFSGRADGFFLASDVDISINRVTIVHGGLMFGWDLQLSERYGLYITPFFRLGTTRGMSDGSDFLAFDLQFGAQFKMVLNDRFYLAFQPLGIHIFADESITAARWNLNFKMGVTF